MSIHLDSAISSFTKTFDRQAEFVARAPGRVNLIGEHTDYNHGFVLPMAIERDTTFICASRDDRLVNVRSMNFEQLARIDLDNPVRSEEYPWLDYITGVVTMLQESGRTLSGADIVIFGEVPIGSGLSSSASLEMAAVSMFEHLGGFAMADVEAAKLCSRVENEYLGVSSGIMDQFISRLAKKDHALFLDCRSMEYELVPANLEDAVFVIADTGKQRTLADSKYNERVEECNRAVTHLNEILGLSGTHLRDFGLDQLKNTEDSLGHTEYLRAKYVITENARTERACEALRKADLATLGELMNESHDSLDENYQVTCDELNLMTEIARSFDGCYGSRMTGAGFGGCTVSLVDRDSVDAFIDTIRSRYDEAMSLESKFIVSSPAAGAEHFAL